MKRILRSWQGSLRAKLIDMGDDPDVRAIRLALLELGTDTISHARGRSLLDHLLGTGQILENWASRRIVCRAGTFHSVYSTDVFPRAAIGIGDRKRISAAIGSEAERLVYLFCAVDRARFLSLVEGAVKAGTLSKTIKMSSRFSSKESLVILHPEIVSLLTIYAANLAEQSAAPDGGPTPWLFTFSKIAQLIKQIGGEEIPNFKDGNPFADTHDEVTYINTYQSWLDAGVLPTNQAAFPACDSLIGEPWLWRALWSACDRHLAESQTYSAQGLQNLTIMVASVAKR